ncbi:MAG: hypothetical protein RLZ35_11 [Pseudomonadota bacterium]|jgi:Holliday junction DNA helicase RuvA
MIGRLSGILIAKKNAQILIDVQGVGYECQLPFSDTLMLGEIGSKLVVWTHLQVKEDAHELYGFLSQVARQFFRLLIKISGVGPKMALTILSGVDLPHFVQSIERQDATVLTALPGIGQKTAERLMLELRDKVKKNPTEWQQLASHSLQVPSVTTAPPNHEELVLSATEAMPAKQSKTLQADTELQTKAAMLDAVSALVNLGYKPSDAHQAVSRVFQQWSQSNKGIACSSEALIRDALQGLARA